VDWNVTVSALAGYLGSTLKLAFTPLAGGGGGPGSGGTGSERTAGAIMASATNASTSDTPTLIRPRTTVEEATGGGGWTLPHRQGSAPGAGG
jgi:hypothetical protein